MARYSIFVLKVLLNPKQKNMCRDIVKYRWERIQNLGFGFGLVRVLRGWNWKDEMLAWRSSFCGLTVIVSTS